LNRLHENAVWSMRGNFLDLPTDCPQRDERLGWTGDINVFAPTACFLFDVAGFLSSWLADLAAEQTDDRGVPFMIPNVMQDGWIGTAVWGDAAVAVPWTLFERYGDIGVLRTQYRSMRRWVDWIVGQADDQRHWEGTFQFGDWLDPAAPPGDPGAGRTDRHLIANAWFCHSLDLVARTAEVLGAPDDAARYRSIERTARASFARRYVGGDGRMTSDSQTAYALAIRFDLVEAAHREFAGRRLAELVRHGGCRIGTGFVGTPIVCDALCDVDQVDTAYDLLLQTEPPSWLYPVLQGATTIWERWDGIRPDGSRNSDDMNSFNHYAVGAVADWLHRSVAGLAPAEPGYRRLLVQPRPGRQLDHAAATHDTPYGRARVSWRRHGEHVTVEAVVPPGTTATVVLPDGRQRFDVASGSHAWTVTPAPR
jgi:alpha-L-rhamnosidase